MSDVVYPSNSNKAKAEAKAAESVKLEKVVTGDIERRKKPLGAKIRESFMGDDAKTVGAYLIADVLVPAAKNLITDMVTQGIERMLFGAGQPRSSASRSNYTPYNRVGTTTYRSGGATSVPVRNERRDLSRTSRANHDFSDIVIPVRAEAEMVLEQMQGKLDQYGSVMVADFYDLVGVTPQFTDNKWGWDNLRDAEIRLVRGGGYVILFPPTIQID
jgi:hypothetical protein